MITLNYYNWKANKFLGLSRVHHHNIKQLLDEAEHDRYVKNK